MRKTLRSLVVALVLAGVAAVFAAPAAAAPVEHPARMPGLTGLGHVADLVSELYAGVTGWLEGWVPRSLSAEAHGDMDPNGTLAPAPSDPLSGTVTTDSGGHMDPNG